MSTAPAAENSQMSRFFKAHVSETDPEIFSAIQKEFGRQQHEIELIASENIVSQAVLDAAGSVLTNKYAEGYPGKRYYGGCQFVDIAEELAIERAKKLFNCGFANVQPNSGSQANQGVFNALAKPGDTILGLVARGRRSLDARRARQSVGQVVQGRALHGEARHAPDRSWMRCRKLAHEHKPRIIIAGGSAYPRKIDFAAFRAIADEVGAHFLVDMAHFAGLVAAGLIPSPFPHAHVVTTTTHKTLRGPRGGMILTNDEDIAKKINSAIFPGIQGGPLMHVIAAKAVAFGEALRPDYQGLHQERDGQCPALGEVMVQNGFALVSGGTDTHLILVDLRPKKLTGNKAEKALGRANITCNKNGIPFDPEKPMVTSGIRLGSPAGTTRGFGVAEFQEIGRLIAEVLDGLAKNGEEGNGAVEAAVKAKATCTLRALPDLRLIAWLISNARGAPEEFGRPFHYQA